MGHIGVIILSGSPELALAVAYGGLGGYDTENESELKPLNIHIANFVGKRSKVYDSAEREKAALSGLISGAFSENMCQITEKEEADMIIFINRFMCKKKNQLWVGWFTTDSGLEMVSKNLSKEIVKDVDRKNKRKKPTVPRPITDLSDILFSENFINHVALLLRAKNFS